MKYKFHKAESCKKRGKERKDAEKKHGKVETVKR